MGIEIERKFLLANDDWRKLATDSTAMRQAYLAGNSRCSVRVRLEGAEAKLNIKSATLGIQRQEFEYAIPAEEALTMLESLCGGGDVQKTRHYVPYAGHVWEIDEFEGENAGLIVAELELTDVSESFARPSWLGEEVSADTRYYNSALIHHPFSQW